MSLRYAVMLAYVPVLPGCITTGSTLEETEHNIREAIEGHLKTLRDFGDPVPPGILRSSLRRNCTHRFPMVRRRTPTGQPVANPTPFALSVTHRTPPFATM
jgi:hypothetical protein